MQKRIVILLVLIVFATISLIGSEVPGWVNRVLFDREGHEIWEVIYACQPPADFRMPAVDVVSEQQRREVVIIDDVPTFNWCYGCANTSAAMMMGHFDRNGYSNMYSGPTNGGVCPSTNLSWGLNESPLSATHQGYDGLNVRGHVDDYFVSAGYEGEDPWMTGGWDPHDWADCTGDYMGTSQYSLGAPDGGTIFYYRADGARLSEVSGEAGFRERDGCSGLANFVSSRDYHAVSYYTAQTGEIGDFTFIDYMAEIDAGRPVLIFTANETEGHSMLGVGYDSATSDIYLHDTWDWSTHTMEWNGEYSGMTMNAVCCIELGTNIVESDFEAEECHVTPDFVVEFTNSSSGYPTGYEWDFENDGVIDSEVRNPEWIYEESGLYSVSLRVYNWDTEDVFTREDYIIVNTPPSLNLPASLGFESGESLTVDIGDYSFDADGDEYSLSVSGMQEIMLEQNGMELEVTAPENYTGSEVWEFTLDDGLDTCVGHCTIIVYPAGGAIVYVPDDYCTIQAAIDAAGHGYMVIVRPGTYTEEIDLGDNEIRVGSMYLETGNRVYIDQTVLYGDGDDVITISAGDINQELAGFTVTHSNGGRGLYIGDRPVYIHDMVMHYNMAEEGAGIYIDGGAPIIEYVSFYNNYLTEDGGTVYCTNGQPVLRNLTFYGNYSNDGSAILAVANSEVSAVNLIVWGNDADAIVAEENSVINISYSDLEELLAGEGNISSAPLFVDAGNDNLHLLINSPCIDSGDPDTDNDGENWETDLDDQDVDGSRKDMGAYTYNQNESEDAELISAEGQLLVYPNPFRIEGDRSEISIQYSFGRGDDDVIFEIFNIKGQLLKREMIKGACGIVSWDGNDRSRALCSSGIYLVRLSRGMEKVVGRFLLLR
ncbi:MAG: PKD domain-containing protein [Candidatus Cloacimonetes bacterium]|nr:PKD domain-containing protein [Candidatus Cloacimonadota bacterium]